MIINILVNLQPSVAFHSKEKDGDWYIYLYCLAHENSERAYKNTKQNCKSFKLDEGNAVERLPLNHLSTCQVGLVWFARYCGKMYSRHLFSYGRCTALGYFQISLDLNRIVPLLHVSFYLATSA